jgi:acid phosphatase family membrane protein YuiD
MNNLLQNFSNNGWEVILALSISNVLAQFIKIVIFAIQRKQFNINILFATGGMPSSHTSTVVSMATSVGLIDGFSATTFAIAACVAFVVMYDAAGVRRAASKQAKVLNQMINELFSDHPNLSSDKLKEFLGHTPIQVFAGAGLGILISVLLHIGIS